MGVTDRRNETNIVSTCNITHVIHSKN